MSLTSKRVFFESLVFDVAKDVYEPAEDSFLFAENLTLGKRDRVADVGTGCGILGVVAASSADEVLATDINPHAVRCAKENAVLNDVDHKMLFVQGDLLIPLRAREKFDLILFNAPYLPSSEDEDRSWIRRAWSGGENGREVIDRFIQEVPSRLEPNGFTLLMQSSLSDVKESLKRFRRQGLEAEVVAERALPFFESIVLLKAKWGKLA